MQKKNKQKAKLKSLSDATPEELREAIKMASYWLTDELDGHTEKGAFSVMNLGEEARKFFIKRAYIILKDPECKWKWKEDTKLSTLMINVVRSEMGHVLRKYINQDEPDVVYASSLKRTTHGGDEDFDYSNTMLERALEKQRDDNPAKTEMEMLEELERYESLRDKGQKIARAAVKGNAMLEKYVELVFELPDYRAISKRMKISIPEVKGLESELIAILSAK